MFQTVQKRSVEAERVSAESRISYSESKLAEVESKLREAEADVAKFEKEVIMLELEKSRLVDRIDTLEEGNERFFELKEKQVCTLDVFYLIRTCATSSRLVGKSDFYG